MLGCCASFVHVLRSLLCLFPAVPRTLEPFFKMLACCASFVDVPRSLMCLVRRCASFAVVPRSLLCLFCCCASFLLCLVRWSLFVKCWAVVPLSLLCLFPVVPRTLEPFFKMLGRCASFV